MKLMKGGDGIRSVITTRIWVRSSTCETWYIDGWQLDTYCVVCRPYQQISHSPSSSRLCVPGCSSRARVWLSFIQQEGGFDASGVEWSAISRLRSRGSSVRSMSLIFLRERAGFLLGLLADCFAYVDDPLADIMHIRARICATFSGERRGWGGLVNCLVRAMLKVDFEIVIEEVNR